MFTIALLPLVVAMVLAGLRVEAAMASTSGLRLVAARAEMIPAITKYMSALDVAVLASSTGHDVEGAQKNFTARKYELQTRLADTDVIADVRSGVNTLLNGGQALLDKVLADSIGLRDRVTAYAPLLLDRFNERRPASIGMRTCPVMCVSARVASSRPVGSGPNINTSPAR